MCDYLGVPLAPEKPVGPNTVLQFAGITLDSVLFEAVLPLGHTCKMSRDVTQLLYAWYSYTERTSWHVLKLRR